MGSKLTADDKLRRGILKAIVEVARRQPGLRGPWIFDEARLQQMAANARTALRRGKP